jgi:aryl-alcohol dehydrogenase-like predicted oxidoreductase
LGRLRREQVDIFLLHSPSAADLKDGEALDCLDALKQEGLVRCVGVSCDDQATLASIASDKRVEAIEAPFGPNRQDLLVDLKRAADRGAIVIAREVLSCDLQARRPAVEAALSFCLAEPAIAVVLVGTTDARHLDEAIRAFGSIRVKTDSRGESGLDLAAVEGTIASSVHHTITADVRPHPAGDCAT